MKLNEIFIQEAPKNVDPYDLRPHTSIDVQKIIIEHAKLPRKQ